jgi:hypothetical protein
LGLLQTQVATQLHKKLEAVNTIGKFPVDLLVVLQCLLIIAYK